jgi:hypothetical protein
MAATSSSGNTPPIYSSSSPLNFNSSINQNSSNKLGSYRVVGNEYESLFTNTDKTKFKPFPVKGGSSYKTTHSDDNYDTSVTNLVDWSQNQTAALNLEVADFAYLKDIGVYPNNRLIVARRFTKPIGNDLSSVHMTPISTLISWIKNEEDFLEISFGEHWVPAAGSFETIFNNIGKDLTLSADNASGMSKLGSAMAGGAGALPLPGLTEGFQTLLFQALGLQDVNTNKDFLLAQGDPSLIKEAMQRKTIDKGEAGSGLKCDFKIKMSVEYEQKYINGVDPTLVYYDIITNVLNFATSNPRFMWSNSFNNGTKTILQDIINGNLDGLRKAMSDMIEKIVLTAKDFAKQVSDKLADAKSNQDKIKSFLGSSFKNTVGAIFGKYKIALTGVINALTGSPSTPWHVTIGNPKKPLFASGDLYMDEVSVKLGPVLSWNDLPSSIKIDFTLKNARNLGADEIFERFQATGVRTYQRPIDFYASPGAVKDDQNSSQTTSNGTAVVAPLAPPPLKSGFTETNLTNPNFGNPK